ncbi:tyrosine-type recombinase/integrase [Sphingomonas sp. LY160]|nr:integrase arm-type DNA-binding domain-containing protein [Sphingomonas sp. LY160]MEA1072185.1 tyrosine-type recombinase/integrase [Sphingomonas sp. LY160]
MPKLRSRPATVNEVNAFRSPGRHSVGSCLILSITPGGSRSWLARVRDGAGRRRDIGLGAFPEVSLAEARERAQRLRREVRDGLGLQSPREKRKTAQGVLTFKAAAEAAHAEKRPGWRNAKHAEQWISTLRQIAYPEIGDVSVNEVDGPAIVRLLRPVWLKRPETARRVRQRIGVVLNWAYAHGYRMSEAPMAGVANGLPTQPQKSRHFDAMPYPALPRFMEMLSSSDQTIGRMAVQFTVLTAARSGEVRGALKTEFDLEERTWTIPASRMKAGREHIVALSACAVAILKPLLENGSSQFVFPGARGGALSDATLTKVLRDSGVIGHTVHGFRSSFRDWAAETMRFPGELAEAALAHTIQNKVEAAYRRTNYLDQRRSLMEAWASFIMGETEAQLFEAHGGTAG